MKERKYPSLYYTLDECTKHSWRTREQYKRNKEKGICVRCRRVLLSKEDIEKKHTYCSSCREYQRRNYLENQEFYKYYKLSNYFTYTDEFLDNLKIGDKFLSNTRSKNLNKYSNDLDNSKYWGPTEMKMVYMLSNCIITSIHNIKIDHFLYKKSFVMNNGGILYFKRSRINSNKYKCVLKLYGVSPLNFL